MNRYSLVLSVWSVGVGIFACLAGGEANAATLFDDSVPVAATASLEAALPEPRPFTVPAPGRYRVLLADLGVPASFTRLSLVVTRGADKVIQLDAVGEAEFDAQAGSYLVRVAGDAPAQSAATFSVEVTPSGSGPALLQYTDGMVGVGAVDNPAQSTFESTFPVNDAGTYQVTLTDRAFPASLASIDLLLLRQGSSVPAVVLSAPGSLSFNATGPGMYSLFVVATGSAGVQAGLFSVRVAGGPLAEVRYASTEAVGILLPPATVALPATDTYTLVTSDFELPAPLADFQAAVVQRDQVLATNGGSGSTAFPGLQGDVRVFAFARGAASPGGGSHGLKVLRGLQLIHSQASVVPGGFDQSGIGGYAFPVDIPAAGTYRLVLADYQFPGAFTSMLAIVAQQGTPRGSSTVVGSIEVPLQVGRAEVLVLGRPSTGTANGLLGISLGAAGGTPLLERTQGVGGLFTTRTVTVTTAGSYDVRLSDLAFPASFAGLSMAATRGTTRVGQIFGSGSFSFAATPGTYSINVLAQLPTGGQFGLYGARVENSPLPPTLTMSANPASVSPQQRTTLTWAATDAISCAASGGWTGSRPASGSQEVGPFSTDTTFVLTCTGPGGSANRSVTVSVSAPAGGGGGGGSLGLAILIALLIIFGLRIIESRWS